MTNDDINAINVSNKFKINDEAKLSSPPHITAVPILLYLTFSTTLNLIDFHNAVNLPYEPEARHESNSAG